MSQSVSASLSGDFAYADDPLQVMFDLHEDNESTNITSFDINDRSLFDHIIERSTVTGTGINPIHRDSVSSEEVENQTSLLDASRQIFTEPSLGSAEQEVFSPLASQEESGVVYFSNFEAVPQTIDSFCLDFTRQPEDQSSELLTDTQLFPTFDYHPEEDSNEDAEITYGTAAVAQREYRDSLRDAVANNNSHAPTRPHTIQRSHTDKAGRVSKKTPKVLQLPAKALEHNLGDVEIGQWIYDSKVKIGSVDKYRQFNGIKDPSQVPEAESDPEYEYSLSKKAGTNAYEPFVVRNHIEETNKDSEGLCPYCKDRRFLRMNDSSYLHHLGLIHGVFSSGHIMPNGETACRVIQTHKTKAYVFQEGMICPHEDCKNRFVRLKSITPNSADENRHRVFWRHLKDNHNVGKKIKKKNDDKAADKDGK